MDDSPGSLQKSSICGRSRKPNVNKKDGGLRVRFEGHLKFKG